MEVYELGVGVQKCHPKRKVLAQKDSSPTPHTKLEAQNANLQKKKEEMPKLEKRFFFLKLERRFNFRIKYIRTI